MDNYNNGTSFNLSVTKRDGDKSESTTVTTSSAEDIRRILNRFDTLDPGYDAEEGNVVNPEEYMPYGEGSLDIAMSDMSDDGCGCEEEDNAQYVTIKRDGTLELDDDIQRMKHLSGIKETEDFSKEFNDKVELGVYLKNLQKEVKENPNDVKLQRDLKNAERRMKHLSGIKEQAVEEGEERDYSRGIRYGQSLLKKHKNDKNAAMVDFKKNVNKEPGAYKQFKLGAKDAISEDADFDYRDEGNGPNDPTDYNYANDILAFARKGHSKKGNKITNMSGDNPLLDSDEEGEEMYESMLADWAEFKKQPINEDWGSSDTSAALNVMQNHIDREYAGKQNPESITDAAEIAAEMYADHMGYTPQEAADWLVSLYVKRKMRGLEQLVGRPKPELEPELPVDTMSAENPVRSMKMRDIR